LLGTALLGLHDGIIQHVLSLDFNDDIRAILLLREEIGVVAAKRVGFPEASIILGNTVIELTLSPKSKSAHDAIHAAEDVVRQSAYQVPIYLRLTPVGLADADKYDYSATQNWRKIQYLPDEIKDMEFYHAKDNNPYEKQLKAFYDLLKQTPRTNELRKLK